MTDKRRECHHTRITQDCPHCLKTTERKETVEDVVREMRADGESPPSDPRDSSIQNILRPWRNAMKDRAARIEAAFAREIAERYAVMHEQGLTIRTLEAEIALLKDECRRLADRAGGFMELARRHGATEKELWP